MPPYPLAMVRPFVVFALFSALSFDHSIAQSSSSLDPVITGYVTRVVSLSDFDVDGLAIVSSPKTQFAQSRGTDANGARSIGGGNAYLGERVSIFGRIDRKKHRIQASEIVFLRPESRTLSGLALVDQVLEAGKPGEAVLRADGYVIRINASTKTGFAAPISALVDVNPGTWIAYSGALDSSGALAAEKAAFQPNTVSHSEAGMIGLSSYDASAVPDDSKQNPFQKYLIGLNPQKIPPFHDIDMQARVNRIGKSLIPAFQRTLPDDDPRKIHFQFQLIDGSKWKDALTLPSGIILVPHQIVERLPDDSQLAAVLADNVATAIEKQSYRLRPAETTLAIVNLATGIGGFFVPGLGLTSAATGVSGHKIQTDLLNQSGRVSLGLLHDAGYDINQAPIAWWTLASKPGKTLAETTIPSRAGNLYQAIGLIWRNYPLNALRSSQSHL
jgi:hypothetical protein